MKSFFKKYTLALTVLTFLIIDFIFNLTFVEEILKNPQFASFGQDTLLTQYFGEYFYKKLIIFHNPFSYSKDILYPFGTPTVFAEGGFINSLYFVFLRPFFSAYTSLLIVVLLSLFFAEIAMYALLRKLGVNRFLSLLFSLVFAFSPFVSVRIQYHFNYTYHFLFPLATLLILLILRDQNTKKLFIYSTLLGLTLPLFLFNTLYYVSFFALFLFFFGFFYFLTNKRQIYSTIRKNTYKVKYFLVTVVVAVLCVLPFITQAVYAYLIRDHRGQPHGRFPGGTIEFSAKPLDIFLPSEFNPFFGNITRNLNPTRQPIEQIIYPGLLVLAGIFLYLRSKKKKRLFPLFITGLTFYILSLGPYLQIGNFKSIPLPYQLIHSLPILSQMRTPVRYGVVMSFSWVILAALVFQDFFKRKKIKSTLFYSLLIGIFIIDQSYILQVKPEIVKLPLKSYQLIKNDPLQGGMMEIPYVIQDGFLYQGRLFYSYPMIGQLIHSKPIIGGYLARISPYKLNYYIADPLLSYFGKLIDDRRDKNLPLVKPTLNELKNSSDFLNLRYVLVRKDIRGFKNIAKDLEGIGYKVIVENDNGFSLFIKKIPQQNLTLADIGKSENPLFLYGGWSKPEIDHRWVDGDFAGAFFKSKDNKPRVLKFTATAYKVKRSVSIYYNGKLQNNFTIDINKGIYEILIKETLTGLNRIDLIIEKIPMKKSQNEDQRDLSLDFFDLKVN